MKTYNWDCFFFQAEDGIRDVAVTGVQTCALPISAELRELRAGDERAQQRRAPGPRDGIVDGMRPRSEERRVGKSVEQGGRRLTKKKTPTQGDRNIYT